MMPIKRILIRSYEKGLLFRDREFQRVLDAGKHWFVDPLNKIRVDVVSMRDPWLIHEDLDVLVKAGVLADTAVVLDLKDYERALVWVDNRFECVLGPGQYALWKTLRDVRYEVVDARAVRFDHADASVIRNAPGTADLLNVSFVEQGYVGVLFQDGTYKDAFKPGQYMFWKGVGKVKFYHVDMRETIVDIAGQEIMTADKVTLRINAMVTCKVVDAKAYTMDAEDARQALYREAQLALRAVIGTYELDKLLGEKEAVAEALEQMLRGRAADLGFAIIDLGIRDVILPGEMKELMNKVIEARKAADANLITRREETAAMRSQANTARILDSNPTLMRLRELDVLEKIAEKSKLNVVLGEKGLAERMVNLL